MYLILFWFLIYGAGNIAKTDCPDPYINNKPEDILQKMSERLGALNSIGYTHRRELNYPSTSYYNVISGKAYIDFTSNDKLIGARYYFREASYFLCYNGSESFICNDIDQSIVIDHSPKYEEMESLSFLNHSIFSLKKALPWIIPDKSIPKHTGDTIMGNKPYYLVWFTLRKSAISTLGKRWELTDDIDITYRILVDKKNYLPVEIYQTNNRNSDILKTSFTDIKENPDLESESLLYYSSYLKKYKEKKDALNIPLIKPGDVSFDWELKNVDSDQPVLLSALKGKVVLLDFWICHCSYCIKEIPEIESINNKFRSKNFRLLGINAYDAPEMIRAFREKRKPINHELLYMGDSVRLRYGIPGFPTVILLDKKGVVLYAGELDRQKIENLIEKNL